MPDPSATTDRLAHHQLVIVGAGGCGMIAALAAAKRGLHVLLLEKAHTLMGNTTRSTGLIPAANTRFQRQAGIFDDTPELMASDIFNKNHHTSNAAITRLLCESSAPLIEWLVDAIGCAIICHTDFLYPGQSRLRMHGPPHGYGAELSNQLLRAIRSEPRIELRMGMPVSGLVWDGRRVTGVRTDVGEIAASAVILALNGFGANSAMVQQYLGAMEVLSAQQGTCYTLFSMMWREARIYRFERSEVSKIMEKSTLISEMQKFHFGSKIFCSDGEEGVLTHLGFDANARRLVSLGVKYGRFFGKTVSVPFSTVTDATGVGVTLTITQEQLVASSAEVSGVLLDNHSVVQNTLTSAKGTLKLVAVHPESGALAYLVAHLLRPGQDTLLREELVKNIDAGQVIISLPDADLQTLHPYRSDEDLQREVESVLFDFTPLHIDLPGMTIRVLDSVLYLDGNISSSLRGDIVEDQASGVQGLLEIKNRLIGDDILAGDLAMALGRDPRTHDLPIGVYPRLGVVRLSGAVHNEQQKAAAEEIARSFEGARSVTNDLVIRPNADLLNVMASSAGGEAEDKVPGKYTRHTR